MLRDGDGRPACPRRALLRQETPVARLTGVWSPPLALYQRATPVARLTGVWSLPLALLQRATP